MYLLSKDKNISKHAGNLTKISASLEILEFPKHLHQNAKHM